VVGPVDHRDLPRCEAETADSGQAAEAGADDDPRSVAGSGDGRGVGGRGWGGHWGRVHQAIVMSGSPRLGVLDDGTCLDLIRPGGVGRVVIDDKTGPIALPVNYVTVDPMMTWCFRPVTAPSEPPSRRAAR